MADHLTNDHLNVMVSGCPQLGVLDRNLAMGDCRLIQVLQAAAFWFGVPRDTCYVFSVYLRGKLHGHRPHRAITPVQR